MDLLIPFDGQREPLYRQIYERLRGSILSGQLEGGKRLPSSRDLADQLDVSRNVVMLAYEQLEAEGYVEGRSGSGTYVSAGLAGRRDTTARGHACIELSRFGAFATARGHACIELSRFGAFAATKGAQFNFPQRGTHGLRYDFAYGQSDLDSFPFEMWRRMLMRHVGNPSKALGYGPPAGSRRLREAVCAHVSRSRGVVCDSSQVLIVGGSQQALDLVIRVLLERGDEVAIEEPAYQGTREALKAAGAHLHAVPVDNAGLVTDQLPQSARAAFVSPSHQFPTGAILSLPRRRALLDWAARTNAVVIEDDYDGEFRYEQQRLESLQGLDSDGRVIYIGTFSRTIFPALRLGYLVLPAGLVGAFSAAKWLCDRHTASLEQEALADLILSGLYERHLRRVRRRNDTARAALLDAVHEYLGDRVTVTGDGAGAHVVLWFEHGASENEVIAAAAARGVRIYGISPYFVDREPKEGILLGYARLSVTEIRDGIRQLGAAMTAAHE